VRAGEMPPKGLPRPKPDEIAAVTGWIEAQFTAADQNQSPDPGHLTAHRYDREWTWQPGDAGRPRARRKDHALRHYRLATRGDT